MAQKTVTLFANSIARENWARFAPRFGSMAFSCATSEERDLIDSLPACNAWLYYPAECGAELLRHGISSTIHAHSGKIYKDGVVAGNWC